ncbi:MAG: GntR family transcriptional regulator [Pseudomonadota bacterium]|nr:GntR family transcriptional regulator [Pseudomonadota bacterium]
MFTRLTRKRTRLADDVYEQILSAILSGEIFPGERLIQETIANQIDVSRTPVREALLRLEQEGILEASGRGGFQIRDISEREIIDLYTVREAVEGFAARLLAGRLSLTQVQTIEKAVRVEMALTSSRKEEHFHANRIIHRTIVEQTNNRFLIELFDSIWNRGISIRSFSAYRIPDPADDRGQHLELLEQLRSGNAGEAEAAMVKHIREGLTNHMGWLSEQAG